MTAETKPTVLVVEDEKDIRELVRFHLAQEGYEVREADSGEAAAAHLQAGVPDLVVLDIMLPGTDGLALCRRLRATAPTAAVPIIMLTAKAAEVDRVLGLEMGADDYVVKPVEPRVLLARIEALLRRVQASPQSGERRLAVGRLVIDRARRSAAIGTAPLDLTTGDFDILWLLASRAGSVVTRDEILRVVRGIDYDGLDRSIDARICRLRRKLQESGGAEAMIKTVRLRGYLFAGDA
jgi:DNA-binding response OmpR family regulator